MLSLSVPEHDSRIVSSLHTRSYCCTTPPYRFQKMLLKPYPPLTSPLPKTTCLSFPEHQSNILSLLETLVYAMPLLPSPPRILFLSLLETLTSSFPEHQSNIFSILKTLVYAMPLLPLFHFIASGNPCLHNIPHSVNKSVIFLLLEPPDRTYRFQAYPPRRCCPTPPCRPCCRGTRRKTRPQEQGRARQTPLARETLLRGR